MRSLLQKNLTAHKQHNFLTSIIYSLTIACVIFLLVTANLQIQSITTKNLQQSHVSADLYSEGDLIFPSETDKVIQKYSSSIQGFYYMTDYISKQVGLGADTWIEKSDKSKSNNEGIWGLQVSSLWDEMQFVEWQDEDLSLGLSEQLYTARGSQAVGLNQLAIDDFDLDLSDYTTQIILKLSRPWTADGGYLKRILWELQNVNQPGLPQEGWRVTYLNIPVMSLIAQYPMDELKYNKLVIKLTDRDDTDTMNAIITDLKAATQGQEVQILNSPTQADEPSNVIKHIVNLIFSVIIAILMFLCFFSLSASMSANLYEQTKEIGVLRSMGFTRMRINLLYFYEALIVVFAACMMGILVGSIVGYSMMLQMNLLLNQKSTFFFPWVQLLEIFFLSLLCAFFSTFGPATKITTKQIASIFRMS